MNKAKSQQAYCFITSIYCSQNFQKRLCLLRSRETFCLKTEKFASLLRRSRELSRIEIVSQAYMDAEMQDEGQISTNTGQYGWASMVKCNQCIPQRRDYRVTEFDLKCQAYLMPETSIIIKFSIHYICLHTTLYSQYITGQFCKQSSVTTKCILCSASSTENAANFHRILSRTVQLRGHTNESDIAERRRQNRNHQQSWRRTRLVERTKRN